MGWTLEASPGVQRDFLSISRFVAQSAVALGETPERAFAIAAKRLDSIRASARRLTQAPHQGTLCPELGPTIRHVTKDRAIFYFDLIEERRVIRLLAVFFGGQDHDRLILARLLSPEV